MAETSSLFGAPAVAKAEPAKVPTAFTPGGPSARNSLAQVGIRQGGRKLQASKVGSDNGVITILMMGAKDASKTCAIVGLSALPHLKGKRKVVLSFDDTTLLSLQNYYGEEWLPEHGVEVFELTRRQTLSDGTVVYRGFDPNEPQTAEAVLGEFFLILEELEADPNVGMVYADHFQSFYEQVCKYYAAHVAGYNSTAMLEIKDWGVRTDTATKVEAKLRRTVKCDGGIVAISGYAPEEKIVVRQTPDGKGGKKTTVSKEVKSPPWLKDDLKRNWLVLLDVYGLSSGTEKNAIQGINKNDYMVEVVTSKVKRFPKGAKVNITGSSLMKFWDPDTVEQLRDLVDKAGDDA